jgi:hypothetical protein
MLVVNWDKRQTGHYLVGSQLSLPQHTSLYRCNCTVYLGILLPYSPRVRLPALWDFWYRKPATMPDETNNHGLLRNSHHCSFCTGSGERAKPVSTIIPFGNSCCVVVVYQESVYNNFRKDSRHLSDRLASIDTRSLVGVPNSIVRHISPVRMGRHIIDINVIIFGLVQSAKTETSFSDRKCQLTSC